LIRKEQEMKVSFISVLYNCHWIAKYRALTECGNCSLYNHFNLLRFFQLHALKSLQFPRSKISKKKKKKKYYLCALVVFIYLFVFMWCWWSNPETCTRQVVSHWATFQVSTDGLCLCSKYLVKFFKTLLGLHPRNYIV
jgi:hypothetical protein